MDLNGLRTQLRNYYQRHIIALASLSAFLLPLKLSISYIPLIPAILLWLLVGAKISSAPHARRLLRPLLMFLLTATICAFFSLDPWRSLRGVGSLAFFACTAMFIYEAAAKKGYVPILLALIAGQTIAALQSFIEAAAPLSIGQIFLGDMTESGQLSLVIPTVLGIIAAAMGAAHRSPDSIFRNNRPLILWCGLNLLLLTAAGFAESVNLSGLPLIGIVVLLFISCAAALLTNRVQPIRLIHSTRLLVLLLAIVLPMLLLALLVNLKRGAWAGVLVGSVLFFSFFSRRLVILVVALAATIALSLTPVRHRLLTAGNDFYISGGRSDIWEIGLELVPRYPLGIGLKNSPILRMFSEEIPPQLKHFHSNLINILVETGWLGLALYLWWIIVVVRAGITLPLSDPAGRIGRGIACGLLSWQVAGLVEYNFGDSEVRLVAFVLVGLLAALVEQCNMSPKTTRSFE